MECVALRTLAIALLCVPLVGVQGATVNMVNQCGYTIWPAYLIAEGGSGGRELSPQASWSVNADGKQGIVWGRTGCSFDGSGRGGCSSGDCGGVLNCGTNGSATATLFEFARDIDINLPGIHYYHYDISLLDAFNIGMKVVPSNGGCRTLDCPAPGCSDAYPVQPTCGPRTTDYTVYFCA